MCIIMYMCVYVYTSVVILEVGAGSGALSWHLRRELRDEAGCEVRACDNRAQALPLFSKCFDFTALRGMCAHKL